MNKLNLAMSCETSLAGGTSEHTVETQTLVQASQILTVKIIKKIDN